jgi:hypothetical protein
MQVLCGLCPGAVALCLCQVHITTSSPRSELAEAVRIKAVAGSQITFTSFSSPWNLTSPVIFASSLL